MARTRPDTEHHSSVLEEPYPAPPTRKPKWGFTVRFEERYQFVTFHALYAAKKHIEAYINGHPYKWISKRSIRTDNGLFIQSEQDAGLETVIEHEYSPLERAWQVPSPWDNIIARFLDPRIGFVPRDPVPPQFLPEPSSKRQRTAAESAPPKQQRLPLGDIITVGDIATALGIEAGKARQALRSLGTPKPASGKWQWSTADADKITAAIKGAL